MDEEQLWAQLDIRTKTICKILDFVLEGELPDNGEAMVDHDDDEEEEEDSSLEDDGDNLRKALKALEEDQDIDMDEFLAKYGLDDINGLSDSQEGSEDGDDSEEGSDSGVDESTFEEEEGITTLREPSSDEESEVEDSKQISRKPLRSPSRKKKIGHTELDDGFFDLSEFNAETERAESRSTSRGRLSGEDDSEDEDMDIDLFANVDRTLDFEEEDPENSDGVYHGFNDYLLQSDFYLLQNCFTVISSTLHRVPRHLILLQN